MKNILSYIIIIFSILAVGCATSEEMTYRFSEKFSGYSDDLIQSVPIDRFEAREVFIVLDKPESCIRIDSRGFVSKESIEGGERQLPVFWILDRQLPGRNHYPQYTEIARNYDSDWKASMSTTFCSQDTMPIERLLPGTYRLRMTLFRKENCRLEFTVFSNVSIIIKKFTGGY